MDRIEALETGADEYMMKPFNPRKLIARIRAVLRRAGHPAIADPDRDMARLVAFGAHRLDLDRRELIGPDGGEVALGKVTGEVAHDFGNILSTIKGSLHLLDKAATERQLEAINAIANAPEIGTS